MGENPIVIAHHLIWTVYGWWLPNDPRGSMSHQILSDLIAELGALHYGRKQLQHASKEIREFYSRAADVLQYTLLQLDEAARNEVAEALGEVIQAQRYTCYACAIMPDHVHILIRKHKHQAEDMIENLRIATRLRLRISGHRAENHPVWGTGPGWKVFLDEPDDIWRTIKYILDNPIKIGLPAQQWPFVTPYDGWPLHPGHRPNSPYARRMRSRKRA